MVIITLKVNMGRFAEVGAPIAQKTEKMEILINSFLCRNQEIRENRGEKEIKKVKLKIKNKK